jgi:hypothetical protein
VIIGCGGAAACDATSRANASTYIVPKRTRKLRIVNELKTGQFDPLGMQVAESWVLRVLLLLE